MMRQKLKYWICVLFHKKETRELCVPDLFFDFQCGLYRGCLKCDNWKKLDLDADL